MKRDAPRFEPDLRAVLEAIVDGVLIVDPDERVVRANAEACRLLEISESKATGRTVSELFGLNSPLTLLAHQVLRSGEPLVQDGLPIEHRHERDAEVSVSLSCIEMGTDDLGLVIVLRDRTLFNSLREQAAHQERLASYGHIAAGIAHEVKNPLGGIRGAAELLGQWATDDARATRTADMIVREVDRITKLVEELMVFARGDSLEIEAVNIHRLLDDVVQLVDADATLSGTKIIRSFDPSIPHMQADPARLTQIFLNLAHNAIQSLADSDERRLEISTRMAFADRLIGADGRPILTVHIAFRDTGSGITPEVMAQLATPFFTTKPKGTGLGLAVSRHWLTKHGGRLRIESEPGAGTTAHVDLPLIARPVAQTSKTDRDAAMSQRGDSA